MAKGKNVCNSPRRRELAPEPVVAAPHFWWGLKSQTWVDFYPLITGWEETDDTLKPGW